MPAADPTETIREAALRMLERRGYACGELAARLVSRRHDPALVDGVIGRLAESGLLDDEAYARELAAAMIEKKPAGADLIRRKLESRHVPAEIAERVADEVTAGVNPVEAAADLARGLRSSGRRSAADDRRRIGAALARRGFDGDIICEALDRAGLPEQREDGP